MKAGVTEMLHTSAHNAPSLNPGYSTNYLHL